MKKFKINDSAPIYWPKNVSHLPFFLTERFSYSTCSALNFYLGGIQQLRGQNFVIFWPPPLRGQFLYPERGQKQTFFDPLPPLILST